MLAPPSLVPELGANAMGEERMLWDRSECRWRGANAVGEERMPWERSNYCERGATIKVAHAKGMKMCTVGE